MEELCYMNGLYYQALDDDSSKNKVLRLTIQDPQFDFVFNFVFKWDLIFYLSVIQVKTDLCLFVNCDFVGYLFLAGTTLSSLEMLRGNMYKLSHESI